MSLRTRAGHRLHASAAARVATVLAIAACGLEAPPDPTPPPPDPLPTSAPTPQPSVPPTAPAPQPQPGVEPDPPPLPGAPPPVAPPQPVVAPFPGYALVWSDEFDAATLDEEKWRSWNGPRRSAVNTAEAVTVSDGALRIATYTEAGVHKTGFLGTDGRLEALDGYFEARIRFRGAPGAWCAFWIMSPTYGVPRGDPATAGVEIDVVEHRVVDGGGWELQDHVAVGLNWDGYGELRRNAQKVTTLPGGAPVAGEWHTYSVLWTGAGYTFYVDGAAVFATSAAVSRRTEWLHLTCEVEDGSWAGSVPPGGYGTRETSATGMDVDWVRVWQAAAP